MTDEKTITDEQLAAAEAAFIALLKLKSVDLYVYDIDRVVSELLAKLTAARVTIVFQRND